MKIATVFLILLLQACTYSITMIHSEGSTDSLDENQTASPTVSQDIKVPVRSGKPIPSLTRSTNNPKG